MTRLVALALLLSILPTSAWGQSGAAEPPAASPESSLTKAAAAPPSNYSLQGAWAATNPPDSSTGMFVGTEISSDVTVGFGLFGLKRERTLMPHVTGYDASRPRSRRVAVGLRLKF